MLAPRPSHDCVQGCCRGQLPYRINHILTSSSPKIPSLQDNPLETTEIACSTDAVEREGPAIPLLSQFSTYLSTLSSETPHVTMILNGVRTTTANGRRSHQHIESDFVRMDAQFQIRSRRTVHPNMAFCSTGKLASDISTQSEAVLVAFIGAFEAFIARRH